MDQVSLRIAEDLHFDMARPFQIFLQDYPVVAEGALGLASRRSERVAEFGRVPNDPHAAPAAAGRGLDEDRKPYLLSLPS